MQIDCDKAVMVTLKHDDKLQDGAECGFQVYFVLMLIGHAKIIFVPNVGSPVLLHVYVFVYDFFFGGFQCALLYTTITGERRIRVINLSLPCTSMLSNLFRSADLDSQFACMLKQGRCLCFVFVFFFMLLNIIWCDI